MSVYKRRYPDGRTSRDWYASWIVEGRVFRKKIGPSKRDAELFLKDREIRRVRGELLGIKEAKRIAFPDLCDEYLVWARTRKAKHTVEDEESAIRRFKRTFTGTASRISRVDIERYLSGRLEGNEEEDEKAIGPSRHNKELKFLRLIFKKAIEWGYAQKNPADGIKRLREPAGRVRYLSDEERKNLLAACSERLRQIVVIALDTGMRKGELLALRWSDIDLKNRLIQVETSKNGERRDIPMSDRVYAILKALPPRVDTPYLFANADGHHQADLKTTWTTAVRRVKLENFTFHDLRHTFASTLVMAGVDIRTVQQLMGHKDITMTMRYSHLSPAHRRSAIKALSRRRTESKLNQSHEA
jgi:integrase